MGVKSGGDWRPGRVSTTPLIATAFVLSVVGWRLEAALQPDAPGETAGNPKPATKLAEGSEEPNFVLIPIRTELQRKLVANGKPIEALVLLNGYALLGKREQLMRSLDALSLQRSLADLKASHPHAAIALIMGYYGPAGADKFALSSSQEERGAIEKACRLVANRVNVPVIYVTSTYDNTDSGHWAKIVAELRDIDLAKETADETPARDADVVVFAVQARITRLLTRGYWNGAWLSADCVVYVNRPLDAKNHPMIGPDLESQIAGALNKLDLREKNRIDYHLLPADPSREAYLRNRDAIMNRFVGNEANALSGRLGFKNNSITW
ncbi:MAG TPA: hypothetical protein VEI07_23470 [Planctomycetaceae bacterium]|nr:hypothetical protein [Planctomycetaceae bacterium]